MATTTMSRVEWANETESFCLAWADGILAAASFKASALAREAEDVARKMMGDKTRLIDKLGELGYQSSLDAVVEEVNGKAGAAAELLKRYQAERAAIRAEDLARAEEYVAAIRADVRA